MKRCQCLEYLGLIFLLLSLISLSIAITINSRFLYVFDIGHLNVLNYTKLDQKTLLENFDQLMRYLNNPFQSILSLKDFSVSASGAHHFREVKFLFQLNYMVFLVTVIPSMFYLHYLIKTDQVWRLIQPFKIGIGILFILEFFMLIGFDRFFILFHETFFNNNDWLFNPVTDPIINILPEQFFMHSFMLFFLLIDLFFFVMIMIGNHSQKWLK